MQISHLLNNDEYQPECIPQPQTHNEQNLAELSRPQKRHRPSETSPPSESQISDIRKLPYFTSRLLAPPASTFFIEPKANIIPARQISQTSSTNFNSIRSLTISMPPRSNTSLGLQPTSTFFQPLIVLNPLRLDRFNIDNDRSTNNQTTLQSRFQSVHNPHFQQSERSELIFTNNSGQNLINTTSYRSVLTGEFIQKAPMPSRPSQQIRGAGCSFALQANVLPVIDGLANLAPAEYGINNPTAPTNQPRFRDSYPFYPKSSGRDCD